MKFLILFAIVTQISASVYYTKLHQSGDGQFSCTILSEEVLRKFRGFSPADDEKSLHIRVRDAVSAPSDFNLKITDESKIIELYGKTQEVVQGHIETLCKSVQNVEPLALPPGAKAPEIVQIVNGGDKSNRIDVVFMGDGYNSSERQEFFDDIARLTEDMFEGDTFKSYLPVFNIWAIYVESVDSGIGYNGAKNTPFKLYRADGQLRGIYTGDAPYARQICLLTGTSGCDYPSLIGNDDYYGGLGGEFVISTRSARTGTVVLRHEMGHNFIYVGEEYDNGGVYRGVNSASSLNSVGWGSWLSGPGPVREERAIYRILEHVWHDLGNGDWSYTFLSNGAYSSWYLLVSVTAAKELDCLEFRLDGQVLPWQTRGFDDREYYDWYGTEGFTSGTHTFTVSSKTPPTNPDIPRMIANINLHEFGTPSEFNHANDHVSAYPTWSTSRVKTYRPTNAGCSMRNMTHTSFCDVCKEGMWMQFFQRISLIDSIHIRNFLPPKNVTLTTLKLGQLRDEDKQIPGEALRVKWYRNGAEEIDMRDQFSIMADEGTWQVEVAFVTPEVRHDPDNLLVDYENFGI